MNGIAHSSCAMIFPIQVPILVPFGHQHQRVASVGDFARVLAQSDAHGAVFALEALARDRIVRFDPHAAVDQLLSDLDGRRLPQIVRIRLERQAEQTDRAALQNLQLCSSFSTTRSRCRELTVRAASTIGICKPVFAGRCNQRRRILPKQEPPQPMPALKNREPMRESSPMPRATSVMFAPTRSASKPISLIKLILSARNALAAYLINSAEARSVETSGTAPIEFRAWQISRRRKRLVENRPVQRIQHLERSRLVCADHDPVRIEAVVERRPFAQEFRVRSHCKVDRFLPIRALFTGVPQQRSHPVSAADRHGRLVHHDGKRLRQAGRRSARPGTGIRDSGRRKASAAFRRR